MVPQVEGYSLERWIGPAGPELMPDIAILMNGMNDAPRDADLEDAVFSVERICDREEGITPNGLTCYTTMARRDCDGAPAGYTRIYLQADRSDGWGNQAVTMVLAEHRGHRLGLLLKLTNLLWLREREPPWSGSSPGTPPPTAPCSPSTRPWDSSSSTGGTSGGWRCSRGRPVAGEDGLCDQEARATPMRMVIGNSASTRVRHRAGEEVGDRLLVAGGVGVP
ncbi:hypothetical protein [Nonomuraea diastatica]|uniref:N-acetyltransferase domain-containing protein n=1 Tax=Nonomuraea diastatica TaxID=1848329 RepID=A0A4R4WJ95_9ACTN|nr:hypothetical protein [Nonomuraea diastatica]TDD16514.1 hypothetical protein E1294_31110 [Nonomuraea diastatica]